MTDLKYIEVAYRLTSNGNEGEELIEEATADNPYNFITGFGIALEAFEQRIRDLDSDATFDFTLEPIEAFGEYEKERIIDLPRDVFSINGHFDHDNVTIGAIIPMQNADGVTLPGKVVAIGDENVTLDMNHPLAGKTLRFTGKVIENRLATNEEIKTIVDQMSGEGEGCGCGSGGCGCGSSQGGCGCGSSQDSGCGCGSSQDSGCGCGSSQGGGCGCGC